LRSRPSNLGHEEDALAVTVAQGLAHADFALSAAVVLAVVEEVDPAIHGRADEVNALVLVWLPADVEPAEADYGDTLPGTAESAVLHRNGRRRGPGILLQGAQHRSSDGIFQELAAGDGHGSSDLPQ
jgi:hypothetical protein